jgi:hypothetical protein
MLSLLLPQGFACLNRWFIDIVGFAKGAGNLFDGSKKQL